MNTIQELFAANLAERADRVSRVSNNVYARFSDHSLVLKVVCGPAAADEQRIALVAIDQERGVIDAVSFTHTRVQKFAAALEELDGFMDVWFA